MHVPIHDEHALAPELERVVGRHRHVVHRAEPHAPAALRVVAGRLHRAEDVAGLAGEQELDALDPGPRGQQHRREASGQDAPHLVRMGCEPPEVLEVREVRRVVHALQLDARGGPGDAPLHSWKCRAVDRGVDGRKTCARGTAVAVLEQRLVAEEDGGRDPRAHGVTAAAARLRCGRIMSAELASRFTTENPSCS